MSPSPDIPARSSSHDGRSPGLRVLAFRPAFPGRYPQWRVTWTVGSPHTVAGAATASNPDLGRSTAFPFNPGALSASGTIGLVVARLRPIDNRDGADRAAATAMRRCGKDETTLPRQESFKPFVLCYRHDHGPVPALPCGSFCRPRDDRHRRATACHAGGDGDICLRADGRGQSGGDARPLP